ncbi:MAG TPA: type II toxin-antitoxin system VapB family antitoxin [Candidatus Paceibacterota bacterium]|nr:type II toxin-antitoxin system VapB family antitoxin [Candidatus Paceibacterota bacterium]
MNIKNEEAHRLATQVASLYDETLTEAVTVALRERLARATAEDRFERLRALALEISVRIPKGLTSDSIDSMLYNEVGLPK